MLSLGNQCALYRQHISRHFLPQACYLPAAPLWMYSDLWQWWNGPRPPPRALGFRISLMLSLALLTFHPLLSLVGSIFCINLTESAIISMKILKIKTRIKTGLSSHSCFYNICIKSYVKFYYFHEYFLERFTLTYFYPPLPTSQSRLHQLLLAWNLIYPVQNFQRLSDWGVLQGRGEAFDRLLGFTPTAAQTQSRNSCQLSLIRPGVQDWAAHCVECLAPPKTACTW